LIPSSGGVYEITFGGELIYSKKTTRQFPDPDEVKQRIAAD
jgi:selT/selW/selH-like putative selenoprotein